MTNIYLFSRKRLTYYLHISLAHTINAYYIDVNENAHSPYICKRVFAQYMHLIITTYL